MKQTVLIIDDNTPIRFLLEAVYKKHFNVVSAPDGLAAMAYLSQGGVPDLIVTDLAMPNVNGWELLDFLSDSHLYKDIPVIVLSGSMKENSKSIGGLYANVHDIMDKPFDPMQLLEKSKRILNKQFKPVLS
ncbi:response regulator [Chitinophaga cymbidii]|uniref:Response regulator n=1 Tax=Chitinophaga cymbidii TaxID=1096750 RepID=A0A512RRN6_9BACT|nr:response regulator [Chitinophaga cymbidii]GEP98361.1 response regulator [Chitinophaga cymbidii]